VTRRAALPGGDTSPSRDDDGTTSAGSGGRPCPVCAQPFTPVRRQTYCSTACRKTAFRRRHAAPAAVLISAAVPAAKPRAEHTVYECGNCGTRRLGQQRCDDCGVFGASLGLGGHCPHCEETISLTDLDLTT